MTINIKPSWMRKVLDLSQDVARTEKVLQSRETLSICLLTYGTMLNAIIQGVSNGKITFQSFFISITVHLLTAAASKATSSRPKCDRRS
jgi:hypothetical protein